MTMTGLLLQAANQYGQQAQNYGQQATRHGSGLGWLWLALAALALIPLLMSVLNRAKNERERFDVRR